MQASPGAGGAEKIQLFEADSAGKARSAASAWLGDFSRHGPLNIRRIQVSAKQGSFVAAVSYSEGCGSRLRADDQAA